MVFIELPATGSKPYQQLKIAFHTGIILDTINNYHQKSYVGVNNRMAIGSNYHKVTMTETSRRLIV